jgi:hypothetical protein
VLVIGAATFAIAIKLITYIAGEVIQRLRRTPASPFLTFVALGVLDAVSLILCITLLRTEDREWTDGISDAAKSLFDVPGNLADLASMSFGELLTAGLGLLFYTAYLKSVVNPAAFRRTDDDVQVLASLYVYRGDPEQAEYWIQKESKRSAESFTIRARIAIASGRFAQATENMSRSLRAQGEPDGGEECGVALLEAAAWTTMPAASWRDLIVHLQRTKTSDSVTSLFVGVAAVTLGSEAKDVVHELLGATSPHDYPLTVSVLQATDGDFAAARMTLSSARPGSEIEEFLRLVRTCVLVCVDPTVSDGETRDFLALWFDHEFDTVAALGASLRAPSRSVAAASLVELEVVLGLFLDLYGAADPFPADRAEAARQRVSALAAELADSAQSLAQFRRIRRAIAPTGGSN